MEDGCNCSVSSIICSFYSPFINLSTLYYIKDLLFHNYVEI